MIFNLTILLGFQLLGEVISRSLTLPLPGPVIGMALLFVACVIRPAIAARIAPTTSVLLAHLSLLFVPAGVGVVGHLDRFGAQGPALLIAVVGSTILAIAVGALTFAALAKDRRHD